MDSEFDVLQYPSQFHCPKLPASPLAELATELLKPKNPLEEIGK